MTPDQEKELQKAAERYKYETIQALLTKGGNTPSITEIFLAGAKHQDAISRATLEAKLKEAFVAGSKSNKWLSDPMHPYIGISEAFDDWYKTRGEKL